MLKVERKLYILLIFLILGFSIFIRMYWASKQDGLYHDEYASIFFSNNKADAWNFVDTLPYNKVLNYEEEYTGKEIKLKYFYDDGSIKDCLKDIASLYKNSNDPFISNLYYSFLRLSFIGRAVYNIDDIIFTGTILNCLFFITSFIFMYKLLKLFFSDNKSVILFGLICTSLLSSSVSFATFLRPYQMQETFFIVFTYLIFKTLLKKDFSVKNFILISLCTGLGYLTLASSILFVLCISLSIFLYYLTISDKESIDISEIFTSNVQDNFKYYNPYVRYTSVVILILVLFSAIIIPLGMKTRYGYLEIEKIETTLSDTKEITSKIKYSSKMFRDSDIYKVYDVKIKGNYNKEEVLEFNVNHMARVNIVVANEFNDDNIKNIEVSYKLKPKSYKILPIFLAILFAPLLLLFIKGSISLILLMKNNISKIDTYKNRTKSIRRLFYFALSFVLAFLVSQIFYSSFFRSVFTSNGRALNSIRLDFNFFNYLNMHGFSGYIIPIIILFLISYVLSLKSKPACKSKLFSDKYLITTLIIFSAFLWALISNILAPHKLERYSIGSYPLTLLILPLIAITFIGNKKIRYIFMIIVSCFYIQGITNSKNLVYLEIDSSNKDVYIFNKKTELVVYGLDNFLSVFDIPSLDNSQKYVLLKDTDSLLEKIDIDNSDNFYLIVIKDISAIKNKLETRGYTLLAESNIDKYGKYNIMEFSKIK